MMYAQAEDDFGRIEDNYLAALGRTAEVQGEAAVWQDLRQRLFVDPADLRARYAASPERLRALMRAWADGLNFYLATHPGTHPKRLARFEPWMALSFTEGSIGGDVTKVSLDGLKAFYGGGGPAPLARLEDARFAEPTGSNGVAIGPALSASGHPLLLINPHTTFFFRAEQQVTSDEGLDAYGAATWGQFFIYQGFNAHAGWMHTTSSADAVDEFAETIVHDRGVLKARYGAALRPVAVRRIALAFRRADGSLGRRSFRVFATSHGPVVRSEGGRWIAVALMNRPVEALEQSFGRTKAVDLAAFMRVAALRANSSNDTVFADDRGETALLLPQFTPRRDDRFDYTGPVDGADPATDWRGLTPLQALPQVVNPRGGWLYNSNDGPWWATGPDSPRRADFPRYMDQVGEQPAHGSRGAGAGRPRPLHPADADRRGVRPLPAAVRAADAGAGRRLRRPACDRPAQAAAAGARRGAARLGLPLVGALGRHLARRALGRHAAGERDGRRAIGRAGAGLHRRHGHARAEA